MHNDTPTPDTSRLEELIGASAPAGFTLDVDTFDETSAVVYTGPTQGDVSTTWHPDARRTTVWVTPPERRGYSAAEAHQLAADLDAVLTALEQDEPTSTGRYECSVCGWSTGYAGTTGDWLDDVAADEAWHEGIELHEATHLPTEGSSGD